MNTAKVERFEDLRCWQVARESVVLVYECCQTGNLARDFETKCQLKRAALSVMNNIAEGFSRYHKREFVRFLDIAQSSAAEINSMLYVLEDLSYATSETLISIRNKTTEARNLTLALIWYLDKKDNTKYVRDIPHTYEILEHHTTETFPRSPEHRATVDATRSHKHMNT